MMGKGHAVLEETATCEHNVRRAPVATATDTLQTSSRISLWARTKVFWTKAPSRSSRASKACCTACCTACFTLHVACAVKTQPLQSPRLPSRRHALSRTAAECAADGLPRWRTFLLAATSLHRVMLQHRVLCCRATCGPLTARLASTRSRARNR